ncbi:MAG: hypothetical protein Q7S87_09695 [Agitococcus sp.]|nr:hypothetical protein [Agitococcus sp.]
MPALVISIFFMLVAGLASVVTTAMSTASNNRLARQKLAQAVVARELQQYVKEQGAYPTSLSAMMAVPGYLHLKSYVSTTNGGFYRAPRDAVGYAVSPDIAGLAWTFRRATVFTLKDPSETLAHYLGSTRNGCNPVAGGATDFATASSWCTPLNEKGISWEQQASTAGLMQSAQKAQNATLDKFTNVYRVTASFPSSSTPIALTSLVTPYWGATSTTAAVCSGIFVWQGVALGCSDLFNRFGQPVMYQRISTKHIVLTSNTSLTNQLGITATITADASFP